MVNQTKNQDQTSNQNPEQKKKSLKKIEIKQVKVEDLLKEKKVIKIDKHTWYLLKLLSKLLDQPMNSIVRELVWNYASNVCHEVENLVKAAASGIRKEIEKSEKTFPYPYGDLSDIYDTLLLTPYELCCYLVLEYRKEIPEHLLKILEEEGKGGEE